MADYIQSFLIYSEHEDITVVCQAFRDIDWLISPTNHDLPHRSYRVPSSSTLNYIGHLNFSVSTHTHHPQQKKASYQQQDSMESVTSIGPLITSSRSVSQEEFNIIDLEIKSEVVDDISWEEQLFVDVSPEEDEGVICTLCIHMYHEKKAGRRYSARVMDTQLWCPHHIVDVDGARAADKKVPKKDVVTKKRKKTQARCTRQSKRRRGQEASTIDALPTTSTAEEALDIDENMDVVEEKVKQYLAESADCTTLTNYLSLVSVTNLH